MRFVCRIFPGAHERFDARAFDGIIGTTTRLNPIGDAVIRGCVVAENGRSALVELELDDRGGSPLRDLMEASLVGIVAWNPQEAHGPTDPLPIPAVSTSARYATHPQVLSPATDVAAPLESSAGPPDSVHPHHLAGPPGFDHPITSAGPPEIVPPVGFPPASPTPSPLRPTSAQDHALSLEASADDERAVGDVSAQDAPALLEHPPT